MTTKGKTGGTDTSSGKTAPKAPAPPPTPGTGWTPVPDDARNTRIAGTSEVWVINGQLHLVWLVPADLDGDGNYNETFPLAYAATASEITNAGLNASPTRTVTNDQWSALGGLVGGNIKELNNPADDPFEFLVEQLAENAVMFPWLLDPEVMAKTAAAWLEGRALSEAELASTEWWRTHTPGERQWMALASSDPAGALQMVNDNRLLVLDMLQAAGINNANAGLVDLLADSFTRGEWSQAMLQNQVQLIADPAKRGTLEQRVVDFFNNQEPDFSLDTTRAREDRVRDMVQRWLGPAFGNWTDQQIAQWAGSLRNDPDAETRLTELLRGQRLALFPQYADPNLTYQDIAGPWRTLASQVWGEAPDETDPFFTQVVATNDASHATQMLRQRGLELGKATTVNDVMGDMLSSFGGDILKAVR